MPARRVFRPNRLPVAPPPRRSSVHSPHASAARRESALEHVRRISREHNKPFDPTKRGTWQGSSKDLVVNASHRKSTRGRWSEEKGHHQTEEEFIVIESEPDDRHPYVLVNPLEIDAWQKPDLYAMHFGAYGNTRLLIWANTLESAIDPAVEWLAEYAPGHLSSEEDVAKLMEKVREEQPGIDDEAAYEKATADLYYTESGYLTSYEWTGNELRTNDPIYQAALEASLEEVKAQNDEQAPNKRGAHRKNASNVAMPGGLASDRHLLGQYIEMAAESMELPHPTNAKVTGRVREIAREYDEALWEALEEGVEKYPPKNGATASDLWDAEAPYLVLMTLRGDGVGIWDGRWDEFYDDTDPIGDFLKEKLRKFEDGTGGGLLAEAFMNAADDSCQ